MNNKAVLTGSVVVALIIGVLVGYNMRSDGTDTSATDAKKLQDSIVMMKDQAASLKTMAELMKSNGTMMSDLGTKYKDDQLTMGGKDMMTVADKYLAPAPTTSGGMMNQMMK